MRRAGASGQSSLFGSAPGAHTPRVSMYVDILSEALEGWSVELTEEALVHYVLACRAMLPSQEPGAGGSAHESLIAEVSFDRALISLAAANGVDVSPRNFLYPQIERRRLETALAARGIDLEVLSRQHAPDPGVPIPTLQP